MLVLCVWAAVHQRHTYLASQFAHLPHRLGKKRAIVAVPHSVRVSWYYRLRAGVSSHDLGPALLDPVNQEVARRRAVRPLERQGYQVMLTRPSA